MNTESMRPPVFEAPGVVLYQGDCIEVMREMPDESVHAIVTDPPYGLGFMGREWDALPPGEDFAREALRVLKPGGHMLAFGGTRTWHRLAVAVEDAGFEIRDSIAWLYGSGFPKSLDVAKAIASGGGRPEDIRRMQMGEGYAPSGRGRVNYDNGGASKMNGSTALTDMPETAKSWEGWGTALKPAFEPIVVARKPLAGTVASTVLAHGTGALNIDATRLETHSDGPGSTPRAIDGGKRNAMAGDMDRVDYDSTKGRWPTNVVLDDSQAEVLDEQSGYQRDGTAVNRNRDTTATKPANVYGAYKNGERPDQTYGGGGGASRFFPVFRFEAKAPSSERPNVDGVQHPTVKPLALMRWLIRLVTPPGGTVLEPFAGSGTTLEAAAIERFDVIGIELMPEHIPLIRSRFEKPIEVTLDMALDDF